MGFARLLSDPDAFFEDESDGGGFYGPLAVVVLAGLATAGSTFVLSAVVLNVGGGVDTRFLALGLTIGGFGSFLGTLFKWLVFAGAFHALSALFDGTNEFRRTVRLIGWGFLPLVFDGAVKTLVIARSAGRIVPSTDVVAFVHRLHSTTSWDVASLLGIAFLAWAAFLWTFAVRHARDLTLRDAAITVCLPAALAIAWRIYLLA